MIAVSNAIYDYLAADRSLASLTGHKTTERHIIRGQGPEAPRIPSVTFRQLTQVKIVEFFSQPRTIVFGVNVWAESETLVSQVAERLIDLLHEADASNAEVHFYEMHWDDFAEGPYWDDMMRCYRMDMRFRFTVRSREAGDPYTRRARGPEWPAGWGATGWGR